MRLIEENDTNNNIMRPKNKNIHLARDPSEAVTNSHTTEKVRRSTRMGQRPKRLENYTCYKGMGRDSVRNVSSPPLCY